MNTDIFGKFVLGIAVILAVAAASSAYVAIQYEGKIFAAIADDYTCRVNIGYGCRYSEINTNNIHEEKDKRNNLVWASLITAILGAGLRASAKKE